MVAQRHKETQVHQLQEDDGDEDEREDVAAMATGSQEVGTPDDGETEPRDNGSGWFPAHDEEDRLWFTNGTVWHLVTDVMPLTGARPAASPSFVIRGIDLKSNEWWQDYDLYGNWCWTDGMQWILEEGESEEDDPLSVFPTPHAEPTPSVAADSAGVISMQIKPCVQQGTNAMWAPGTQSCAWQLELHEDLQLGGFIEHMKSNAIKDTTADRNAHGIEMMYSCFDIKGVCDHIAFCILLYEKDS